MWMGRNITGMSRGGGRVKMKEQNKKKKVFKNQILSV